MKVVRTENILTLCPRTRTQNAFRSTGTKNKPLSFILVLLFLSDRRNVLLAIYWRILSLYTINYS